MSPKSFQPTLECALPSLPLRSWGHVFRLRQVGGRTKLRLSYKFSQFVKGQLIYTGYDTGDRTDVYGQCNNRDNIGLELSYEF